MYFLFVFLISLIITFLFFKIKSKWAKWSPAIIFFFATLLMLIKIMYFPAAEMAILGEVVYAMIFATMTLGALISGGLIHFWKRKQK